MTDEYIQYKNLSKAWEEASYDARFKFLDDINKDIRDVVKTELVKLGLDNQIVDDGQSE